MTDGGKALVLGGGGITGVAWEIGMLLGLAEHGVHLDKPDLVVGTSAGSVVAAQLLGGVPLKDLYEAQLAARAGETAAAGMGTGFALRYALSAFLPNGTAWLGRQALKAKTVPPEERRRVIAERIGHDEWPETRLLITAVEAETGRLKVFDRTSGVSLIDAVAASCAVPLVWPPHTIDGVAYVDGGTRSVANADLARGCELLVALTPVTGLNRRPVTQAESLHVPYAVVAPNDLALTKMGRNPLDPAFRASAAEAGRQQAEREAEKIGGVWSRK
jgi:NTE family protein